MQFDKETLMRVADIAADGVKELVKMLDNPTVDQVARIAWLIWSQFDPTPTAYSLPIEVTESEALKIGEIVDAMKKAAEA